MSAASRNRTYWRKFRKGQGFTLLEAIVAAMVTVILFGLFFQFLIPGMKAYALSTVRTEIQQETLRSLQKIVSDLDLAVYPGVSVYSNAGGPVYLGIVRMENVDNEGFQTWEQGLVVYSWEGPGMPFIRKVWMMPTKPSVPSVFSEAQLQGISLDASIQKQVMAQDVEEVTIVKNPGGPPVSPPIEISIKVKRKSPITRPGHEWEYFYCTRKIWLRNQL